MSGSQLSITLSIYITSMALALIFSILKKKDKGKYFKLLLSIHLTLLMFFIICKFSMPLYNYTGYVFLFFFCSGIITGGYIFRSHAPLSLRIYFSLYVLSIVVFIFSPSLLVKAISFRLEQNEKPNHYHLTSNYFLEEEASMLNISDTMVKYKVTRHFGVFHKTLARNISFGDRIDSLKILSFNPAIDTRLRGYIYRKSITFASVDSIDMHIIFNLTPDEIIQKKKNK